MIHTRSDPKGTEGYGCAELIQLADEVLDDIIDKRAVDTAIAPPSLGVTGPRPAGWSTPSPDLVETFFAAPSQYEVHAS